MEQLRPQAQHRTSSLKHRTRTLCTSSPASSAAPQHSPPAAPSSPAPSASTAPPGSPPPPPSTATGASVDPREAAKFAALAASWWRTSEGPFAPLHALNPARVRFVRESLAAALGRDAGQAEPLAGVRVLDVGCGGGILSEALARLGAQVHGIDVTAENVGVARAHAATDPLVASRVRYDVISAEDLAASGTALYDAVVASEVLEHVSKPHVLLGVLARLLDPATPGAAVVVSTLNRTPAAWTLAIVGAEYVAGVVPRGTHDWHKFITPEEMAIMADASGLEMWHAAGMAPCGPRLSWTLTQDLSVNYIATLTRKAEEGSAGVDEGGSGDADDEDVGPRGVGRVAGGGEGTGAGLGGKQAA